MSTILDALKRSERERKLNEIPTLTDMAAIEEPSPFKWILLTVLVVIAISLVTALTVWVFNKQSSTQGFVATLDANNELPRLSVISYSENPLQRFAMLNNKLLREGDSLAPGVKVVEIQADQVMINMQGEQIVLKP